MSKNKITNSTELRNDLLEAYEKLKADPRAINQVAELANTAGKILASAKLEVEYALARGEKPDIAFLAQPLKQIGAGS
jgi:aspartokinase